MHGLLKEVLEVHQHDMILDIPVQADWELIRHNYHNFMDQ
jgi:hypothetical protein